MRLQRGTFITCMVLAATFTSWAGGRPPVPLTLIAVPAEYTPLQIGQDLAARYPVVLVSYQEDPNAGGLFLHAWDGTRWVAVSHEDFGRAGFVQMTPKRSVIIGSGPGSSALVDLAYDWCPEVLNLASTKSSDVVNTMGHMFEFNASEWQYFAKTYKMDLQDLNAGRRQESWYDQPYTDPERANRGSMVAPPVQPTSHTMTWPPSAPALIEEVETVGTVNAAEVIEYESAEELLEEIPEKVEPPLKTEPLQIRPPSFRGWEPKATSSAMDMK